MSAESWTMLDEMKPKELAPYVARLGTVLRDERQLAETLRQRYLKGPADLAPFLKNLLDESLSRRGEIEKLLELVKYCMGKGNRAHGRAAAN